MQLDNETLEIVHKFDLDFKDDNEYNALLKHARSKINNDEEALINYAVVDLLKEYIAREKSKEEVSMTQYISSDRAYSLTNKWPPFLNTRSRDKKGRFICK